MISEIERACQTQMICPHCGATNTRVGLVNFEPLMTMGGFPIINAHILAEYISGGEAGRGSCMECNEFFQYVKYHDLWSTSDK